jgi:hypothetical protein
MDVREHYLNRIIRHLSYLKNEVELSVSLNLTNINIHAENFYRDFFNLIGFSFNNTNYDNKNAAYVDLIDTINKEAIQVTAQNDNGKILKSIQGFFKNEVYKDYHLQVLLISKKSKDYTTDFTFNGKYNFDHNKDVIDMSSLLSIINNQKTEAIQNIASFLEKEILIERPKTELNEVETIMALLEWLSNDENYKELLTAYECDPDKKINNRFKDYSGSFKDEFLLLMPLYCMSLPESKKSFGLDGVRAAKISIFLIRKSNDFLKEENDDPIKALNKLTQFFEDKITKNGFKADSNAIRYYLLDELFGCNIFSEEI